MTKALSILLLLLPLVIAPLTAQSDRIHWTDGTVTERITITKFNLREIEYRKSGRTETASSDRVADLFVKKVRDRYNRAYGASSSEKPATFLQLAEGYKDDAFLAQFGYLEAVRLFQKAGDANSMFAALDEMATRYPDSGFLKMSFVTKIQYYLGKGKDKDAAKVALRYKATSTGQGYPKGYQLEAEFYETLTSGRTGVLPSSQVRGVMQRIFNDADPDYPMVANRARLELANSLRSDGNDDQAKRAYEEILANDNLDAQVRGGAWLGLGHISLAAGNPADRDPYLEALKQFLRVYVSNRDAAPSVIAESLEFGAKAAEKWGGTDSAHMSRRLKRLLSQEFPDWGK